ncbi:MAG: molybdenum cofactor guanylyltransferase [Spirochaetota bacterium]
MPPAWLPSGQSPERALTGYDEGRRVVLAAFFFKKGLHVNEKVLHSQFGGSMVQASAVILAGGKSSRMGEDKSLISLGGITILELLARQFQPLVEEILISSNDPASHGFLGLTLVPDESPDCGPIMGILSCLSAARHEKVFFTPCDVPVLPEDFIQDLLARAQSVDLVMALDARGRYEPLLAVYSRSLVPLIRGLIAAGERRIVSILGLPGIRAGFVSLAGQTWYRNLNSPEDLLAIGHPGLTGQPGAD